MPLPLPHLVNYPLLRAAPWGGCLPGGVAASVLEDRWWELKTVESTAPSPVTWEGGPGPLSPGSPRPRGSRSAVGGLEAAGCRDLKWCPCRAVGAGELGPARAEPASRLGAGQRPGPGRTRAGAPNPLRSLQSLESRESLRGLEPGQAARCAEEKGDQVRVGSDLAGCRASSHAGTAPSCVSTPLVPLPTAGESWPPMCSAADLKGLAWPRPCLEFLAGESERSTTRLSLPSSFFMYFSSPTRNPGLASRSSPWQMAGT